MLTGCVGSYSYSYRCRTVRDGGGGGSGGPTRSERAATPVSSDVIAMPSTRLTTAVAPFWLTGALVLNGYTTAASVASPMIQAKNRPGCGVPSMSRYNSAAATSATMAAPNTNRPVCASPQAPAPTGARMGMPSVHRQIRMPTSAIRAATTAVATAPAQNRPESSRMRGLSASLGDSG